MAEITEPLKLYYRSDFKIHIKSDAGWGLPFSINFWSGSTRTRNFVACYDGETYTNCHLVDENTLCVAFDDHGLGIGQLYQETTYRFHDGCFETGVDDEILQPEEVKATNPETGELQNVILDLKGVTAVELVYALPLLAAEQERQANERERKAAEAERVSNENARKAAESERVSNEDARKADYVATKSALDADYKAKKDALDADYATAKASLKQTADAAAASASASAQSASTAQAAATASAKSADDAQKIVDALKLVDGKLPANAVSYDPKSAYSSGTVGKALKDVDDKLKDVDGTEGSDETFIEVDPDFIVDAGMVGYNPNSSYNDGSIGKKVKELDTLGEIATRAEAAAASTAESVVRLETAINNLPDGSAVSAQVAKNTAKIEEIRNDIITIDKNENDADSVSIGYIASDGSIGESSNYKLYHYKVDGNITRVYCVTRGASYEDLSIACYSSEQPSAESFLKGQKFNLDQPYDIALDVPKSTRLIIVSNRFSWQAVPTILLYRNIADKVIEHDADISELSREIEDIKRKRLVIVKNENDADSVSIGYIASDGSIGESSNYKLYHYKVDGNITRVYCVTRGASYEDLSIACYSSEQPSAESFLKGQKFNLDQPYDIALDVPQSTRLIIVSNRFSFLSTPTIQLWGESTDTGKNPILIRVATYNTGVFNGIGLVPGTREAKIAYHKAIGEVGANLMATQEDSVDYAGDTDLHKAIFPMFPYYKRVKDSALNNKAFASDYIVSNVKRINYTGGYYNHGWFLAGELVIDGKNIGVISFHFDWTDKGKRALQIQQCMNYAMQYDYAIVMGDTNPEDRVNMQWVVENHLLYEEEWGLWSQAGFKMANNGEFGLFDTDAEFIPSIGISPIDNIFVRGNITIRNVFVVKKDYMDDHFILAADLVIC